MTPHVALHQVNIIIKYDVIIEINQIGMKTYVDKVVFTFG
jgi:hypothetical protein